MHQRDLYVVYVKQYCGSVNTFRAICFSCFEEVRGLLPIGLKLALMLYLCNFSNFFFFLVWSIWIRVMTAYQHLNASQNSPESQLFLHFPENRVSSSHLELYLKHHGAACTASVSDGREHKGAFSARWMVCTTHAALFSLRAGSFDARLLLSLARQG